MTITINRASAISTITSAVRAYLINTGLYQRIYLFDDGDVVCYEYTDCNSWQESDSIVCQVAELDDSCSPLLYDWIENDRSRAEALADWRDAMSDAEKAAYDAYRASIEDDYYEDDLDYECLRWCHHNVPHAESALLDCLMDEWLSDWNSSLCPDYILDDCIEQLTDNGYTLNSDLYDDEIVLSR